MPTTFNAVHMCLRRSARARRAVQTTFEVDQLKTMKGADGIDPTVKERYLTAEAFQELFGMDEAAFAAQPLWRRQQRKKDVGLF